MGGASSKIHANITAKIANNESSTCTVENVCQSATVGNVSIDGSLDCGTITFANNQSTSAFSCDINQSAMATANVVQNMLASATSSWGSVAKARIHENIGLAIANNLQNQCGGRNGHASAAAPAGTSGAAGMGSAPNGGACYTGIVQKAQVDNLSFGQDSNVQCNVMRVGTNNANTTVQCALGQAASADLQIKQSGTTISKNQNMLMGLIMAIFAVVLLIVIGPFVVGGILKLVEDYGNVVAHSRAQESQEAQIEGEEKELQLMELQGAAQQERKKLEREGVAADKIGFKRKSSALTDRPPTPYARFAAAPPSRRRIVRVGRRVHFPYAVREEAAPATSAAAVRA